MNINREKKKKKPGCSLMTKKKNANAETPDTHTWREKKKKKKNTSLLLWTRKGHLCKTTKNEQCVNVHTHMCTHNYYGRKKKKEWRGGFQCSWTCTQTNRKRRECSYTQDDTNTHTNILFGSHGTHEILKRVGKCKSRECHNNQRGWQHSGRGKWTPARWCSEKTTWGGLFLHG